MFSTQKCILFRSHLTLKHAMFPPSLPLQLICNCLLLVFLEKVNGPLPSLMNLFFSERRPTNCPIYKICFSCSQPWNWKPFFFEKVQNHLLWQIERRNNFCLLFTSIMSENFIHCTGENWFLSFVCNIAHCSKITPKCLSLYIGKT